MYEVRVLRAREHDHITPLLASFAAGLEGTTNPTDGTEYLYLISPKAVMDMNKWMKQEPDYIENMNDDDFRNHIHETMRGLISGLTYVHREINGLVGYHGDIKPKNILLFGTSYKMVWKICDFGTSNLKLRDETGTMHFETSHYWAPKEFFDEKDKSGQNHGRAHDVWSLGCIFLLLATMLRHRWHPKGLEKFENNRRGGGTNPEEGAFHKNMTVVLDWIGELETTADRADFKKLLELIKEMLKPRTQRIFSWEVEVDLYDITDFLRPEGKMLAHLKEVVQEARNVDLQMNHDPLSRARKNGRKEPFLKILRDSKWHGKETTDGQEIAMVAESSASTPLPPESKDPLFGKQDVLSKIHGLFTVTSSVALYGLGGTGYV